MARRRPAGAAAGTRAQAGAHARGAKQQQKRNVPRAAREEASAPEPVVLPLMDASAQRDIAGVALAVVAVASLIAVVAPATAPVTAAVAGFYHVGFGLGAYVLPVALLFIAASLFVRSGAPVSLRSAVGAVLIFLSAISLLALLMSPDPLSLSTVMGEDELAASGGYVGFGIAAVLAGALGKPISAVVLMGVAVAGLVVVGFSVTQLLQGAQERIAALAEKRRVPQANETPWGDEAPAYRQQQPRARQERIDFDDLPAPETAFLGNRTTTVIDAGGVDYGEDPFVDVSDQLAAEGAKTVVLDNRTASTDNAPQGGATDKRARTADVPASEVSSKASPAASGAVDEDVAGDSAVDTCAESAAATTRLIPIEEKFAPAAQQGADEPSHADVAPASSRTDGVATSSGAPMGAAGGTGAAPVPVVVPAFLQAAASQAQGAGASGAAVAPTSDDTQDDAGFSAGEGAGLSADESSAVATPGAGASAIRAKTDVSSVLPPMSMLRHNPASASSQAREDELEQTAEGLQATLAEFNLHARVVGWISGPTVTTFKVQPGEGERVSRISSLEDDIALSLAASAVRIFAPIPDTSLVGIEIPNRSRQNVALGDVLPYAKGGPLELAIGRDSEGLPIVADLAKMPHLLIAGTTGSGKSVMINTIISSILMRATPEEVRLVMVDPKRVELAGYNGLPHLYVPVVTEPKQAASALQWGVAEMERRLKIFERLNVRNIGTFNDKQRAGAFEHYDNPPAAMPYLVIIIDELSDLMMVAGKDVEASIVRIAQLGRAAGIHLIVATQRPSSDVVTGLIKANITNRIAFNVATGIDSRVIIDQVGAEKLIGLGDMLFSKVGWGKPKRIQGCFVSDEEIASIVEFLKENGEPDYHEEILSAVSPAMQGAGGGAAEAGEDDPLLWDAARIVVESGLGSTSGLQRRLKVGYARAGRIMDMLEEHGVVGPPDGSKPREVMLDAEGLEALIQTEQHAGDEFESGVF